MKMTLNSNEMTLNSMKMTLNSNEMTLINNDLVIIKTNWLAFACFAYICLYLLGVSWLLIICSCKFRRPDDA